MKKLLFAVIALTCSFTFSQQESELSKEEIQKKIDSVNNSFSYKIGKILLDGNLAEINIPKGYKFLDSKQSKVVLTDLWGNPPSEVLGMLFPENIGPISNEFTYAVEITYSDDGYIKDENAKDIDYQDLLSQMKEDAATTNEERKKLGYQTVKLVGWASKPYYDEQSKKLHWAKELNFEGDNVNTLNYNIRVLGRGGYLNLNAISTMEMLPLVKKDVTKIINSVAFTEGNTYADFNPEIDEVAAYGIAGLIAGKLLSKVGFFAVLLKFWKVILIAFAAGFAAVKRFFFGKKEEEVEQKQIT